MNTLKQEIFAVGKWNGFEFSLNDLRKMATSFAALGDVLKVPLKLGHNDDQAMTDGKPALGWVSDLSVNESASPAKLVAEFSQVPDVVFSAMERGLYRSVSVELDFDVKHKGAFYDFVLTGVALLGSDLPAVNVLNDLTKYMARDSVHVFSFKEGEQSYAADSHNSFTMGDTNMSEIDDLKAKLAVQDAELKAQKLEFSKKESDWKKAEGERKAEAEKVKFERGVEELKASIEELIAAKQLLPNQRDGLLEGVTPDNLGVRKFALETIKLGIKDKDLNKGHTQSKGSGGSSSDDDTGRPDEQLMQKISAAQLANPGMSFTNAKHMVFRSDPKLAIRYMRMDGMTDS
jgi:hypothetical protein